MTTATDRSSTGGICQARVISHAETPASASALLNASTPSVTASRRRDSRGRSNPAAVSSVSDIRMVLGAHRHHLVSDLDDLLAMGDHHHGGPCPRTLDDGTQNPSLGVGVEVCG